MRDGVVNLYRWCDVGDVMYEGGVVSICMARTDDGLRKGERVLNGVYGEDEGCRWGIGGPYLESERIEMSSSE